MMAHRIHVVRNRATRNVSAIQHQWQYIHTAIPIQWILFRYTLAKLRPWGIWSTSCGICVCISTAVRKEKNCWYLWSKPITANLQNVNHCYSYARLVGQRGKKHTGMSYHCSESNRTRVACTTTYFQNVFWIVGTPILKQRLLGRSRGWHPSSSSLPSWAHIWFWRIWMVSPGSSRVPTLTCLKSMKW